MLGVPAEGVCAVKRWTFAGFFRIAIDVLQLAFVDFFNKCARRPPAARRSPFSLAERARLLRPRLSQVQEAGRGEGVAARPRPARRRPPLERAPRPRRQDDAAHVSEAAAGGAPVRGYWEGAWVESAGAQHRSGPRVRDIVIRVITRWACRAPSTCAQTRRRSAEPASGRSARPARRGPSPRPRAPARGSAAASAACAGGCCSRRSNAG